MLAEFKQLMKLHICHPGKDSPIKLYFAKLEYYRTRAEPKSQE